MQRKLGHLLLLDHRPERHRHSVDHGRVRRDGDGFLHGRGPSVKSTTACAADHQPDALADDGLES